MKNEEGKYGPLIRNVEVCKRTTKDVLESRGHMESNNFETDFQ